MDRPTVIRIQDLNIDYRNLYHFTIQRMIKNPALKGGDILHAVRGANLEVKEGEILGIIGENGAGKSTLLKAVAGIFQPDAGSIETFGKRVSLMSLGVGFKWELSGRDNVMLAGLLLRYPASYVRKKMQEIIDFSELGDAIDRPVRTYSSGMYSKLSFAITAVLETDIMLIDELMSVGDEQFQAKSFKKIQSLVHEDRMTSILVSHDLEMMRNTCTRVVWMHRGKIQASGSPEEITEMYQRWSAARGAGELTIRDGVGAGTYRKKENNISAGDSVHAENEKIRDRIFMFRGIEADEKTGILNDSTGSEADILTGAVNWEPFFLRAGAKLRCRNRDFIYRVFVYRNEIPKELIYTASPVPQGNMTVYDPERSDRSWRDEAEYEMKADGFLRIAVRSRNGKNLPEGMACEDLFEWEKTEAQTPFSVFEEKIERIVRKVNELRDPEDAVILLLADTHASYGGTWNDTAAVLQELGSRLHPDAAVHLGDLTDGTLPAVLARQMAGRIRRDLEKAVGRERSGEETRALICPGNHDLARLPGETGPTDPDVFAKCYLGREQAFWFTDAAEKEIRMIFLSSFEPGEEEPYGFSEPQIRKLEDVLAGTPETYGVLIFSHIPPGREKTRWNEKIRNSGRVMALLEKWNKENGGRIRGVFYGHDHRDRIEPGTPFPVIGTGCARLEDKDGCPLHQGAIKRIPHTVSQELFDTVIVKKNEKRLEMIRFGSGEDRSVYIGSGGNDKKR